jgi:hypothetical protein
MTLLEKPRSGIKHQRFVVINFVAQQADRRKMLKEKKLEWQLQKVLFL